MVAVKIDFKGLGEVAIEKAAREQRIKDAKTAPGPDLSSEACVDCGAFGPWGDGKWFYCRAHAPDSLVHAARHFACSQEP